MIVGYERYIALLADLTSGKELISTGMTQEGERCRMALKAAASGRTVALVSSGDPGVYGMAGLALEIAQKVGIDIDVEIVPGVTAANAAAARMGAPLMLDYATISLSDLLVPWDTIRRRLTAVAAADLVVALYNPASRKRQSQLAEAAAILLAHRPRTTPVGIATALGDAGEQVEMSTLGEFLKCDIGMRSIVIVGNSTSRVLGALFLTPRGYQL